MTSQFTPDSPARDRIDKLRDHCATVRVRFRTAIRAELGQGLGITPVLFLVAVLITLFPVVAFGQFVISRHADGYVTAGVDPSDAYSGAIVGQVLVAAALATVAILLRRGASGRSLAIAGTATAILALAFVLLPNAVAGNSWLTIVLAILTTLAFDALLAVVVGVVALLMIGK